jgi:hypothetical protein
MMRLYRARLFSSFIAFLENLLVFFACHAFCITACKKPAKQLAGRIFISALPFAVARLDWAEISRAVGALLRLFC